MKLQPLLTFGFLQYMFSLVCFFNLLADQKYSFLLFLGIVLQIIDQILTIYGIQIYMKDYLMFIPPFALVSALIVNGYHNYDRVLCLKACNDSNLADNCTIDWMCQNVENCCDDFVYRYRAEGLGKPLVTMFTSSIIFWIIIGLIDYNLFRFWFLRVREMTKQ